MRIVASQDRVAQMLTRLRSVDSSPDGWTTHYLDPLTGARWMRTFLGSDYHGGGMPILIAEPTPSASELLELAARSADLTEVAASSWLLAETDRVVAYKAPLIALAEAAAARNERSRAALMVVWGALADEGNLQLALGKSPAEVTADHEHFRAIAARARTILDGASPGVQRRDSRLFGLAPR